MSFREFRTYTNSNGGQVEACRVQRTDYDDVDANPRVDGWTVYTTAGTRDPKVGDVVVRTQNSNVYDVYPASYLDDFTEGDGDGQSFSATDSDEESVTVEEYNPSDHKVADVNEYVENLPDTEEGRAEAERVYAAEEADRNRAGVMKNRQTSTVDNTDWSTEV